MIFFYIIFYPLLPIFKIFVLIFLSLLRLYRRVIHSYHWFDTVTDQIMLGGAPLFIFQDDDFLEDQNVTAILNVCPEAPPYDKRPYKIRGNFLYIRVFDRFAPSMHQLKKGVLWMDEKVRSGEKILVHCAVGAMRSVTFVAAWYMYAYGWDLTKTLRFLKEKRPQMHVNARQKQRLEEFETLVRHGSFSPAR